jgi:hypothetical protein
VELKTSRVTTQDCAWAIILHCAVSRSSPRRRSVLSADDLLGPSLSLLIGRYATECPQHRDPFFTVSPRSRLHCNLTPDITGGLQLGPSVPPKLSNFSWFTIASNLAFISFRNSFSAIGTVSDIQWHTQHRATFSIARYGIIYFQS